MPDLAYWSAVCVGAFALLVEAFRQYKKPIPDYLSPGSGLSDAEVLATQSGYMRGLLFYAGCYLLLYFALLSSAALRALWLETDSEQNISGAQSFLADDVSQDILFNGGKSTPLYVSTALITALSLGFGKQIEGILRSIAYWLAGIPRGYYYVIDIVRGHSYGEVKGGHTLADVLANRAEPALNAPDGANRKNAYACDVLAASIFDLDGERIWPRQSLSELADKIEELRKNHKATASLFQKAANEKQVEEALESLRKLRADTESVFAQLYIRSDNLSPPADKTAAGKIILTLHRKGLGFGAVAAQAALIGVLFGIPLFIALDLFFRPFYQVDFDWSKLTLLAILTGDWGTAFSKSLQVCIPFGVAIWFAAGLAAVFQNNLSATGAWRRQKSERVRFLQLTGWSLVPALIATVALFGARLVAQTAMILASTGRIINRTQVAEFVRDNYGFLAGCFGLAFIVAYFTLRTIDHRKVSQGNIKARAARVAGSLVFLMLWLAFSAVLLLATYAPITVRAPELEVAEALVVAIENPPSELRASALQAVWEWLRIAAPAVLFFPTFGWLMSQEERRS